jgi:hypothetical protein
MKAVRKLSVINHVKRHFNLKKKILVFIVVGGPFTQYMIVIYDS